MNAPLDAAPAGLLLDREIVAGLAVETQAPVELVQRIYEEEWLALRRDARITQFLNVIAARKVRLRMRKH